MDATFMRELNNRVICDIDGADEQDPDDDVPHSLLRYLETSRSRAAVCEKLILEDFGDFPAAHPTEDTMNFPFEVDEDTRRPKEQVVCDTEDEENNTSADARLLPAPTETEALFTHNVSVCPNNEDEQKHLVSEDEAERQKRRRDEMKEEELKRQIERDFQTQLKKMMEAEKLQQKELELMGRRAQEKLDQELLLQQELMSDLKRRVQEERRMREEEQKRMKEEEDKRTREEEKIKIEAEEMRRKKEEERRIKEMELKKEEERKREEEEKRRVEREEKRKREEEKNKIEMEKRKLEEEMRIMKEEEEREKKEEEEKRKREEERKEKAKKKVEKEKRKMEEDISQKKEEERKIEEMELKKEEERKREEEEKRRVEREEKRKREEEKTKIEMEKRKLEEEMRMMKEEEEREKKEEEKKRKREEERKEEAKKKVEKEKIKMEEDISQKEEDRKKREEETRKIEEEVRITKEIEERKKQETRKNKEEEEEERKKQEKTRKNKEEERKKQETRKNKEEEERKKQEETRKNKEEERKKQETRKNKEEEERKKQEETRKNKEEKEEEALKKFHAEMKKRDEKEVEKKLSELRKKEEEDRKTKEEPRPIEEDEKRKREDERKTKEEERRRTREDLRQEDEEGHQKAEAEIKLKEDEEGYKRYEVDNRKMEHESKTKEKKHEEEEEEEEEGENVEAEKELKEEEAGEHKKEVNRKSEEEITLKEKEESKKRRGANEPKEQIENNRTSSSTEVKPQQHDPHVKVGPTSTDGAAGPASVPEPTEKRRLAWMKDCVSWSELSLQNRSKPRGSARSRRGPRGSAGSGGPAPLCPDALLRSTGCKSLQEVTSVTLEDLPGRGSSTLALCTRLRSLTIRRCGLRSLEGINQLPQLCHIDVQENDISFVDCENMSSLRVLRLGHNKLTSIHGLTGAEHLDVLDLSHNSITRIAGLESMRRLQRLSVDHNQLISTRGLGCVYTLLHLSCSHNHLASVEGLENSALLNTLDLSANSLAEPPSLSNQVLLRELHLDDNNISSLQGLTACWLPLMQHLSVAQNRITRLPPMSDCVSLSNLDLRFNCMSELQNVCESLEGCVFLREVHLSGNPLQQERGWRAALQRAAPGLRAVDGRQTDSAPTPPAAGRVGPASGGFLAFCQAQLQQTRDLQRRHGRELSGASSSLDAVTTSCRHHDEVLQLAMDHRFAHEHGDATVAAGRETPGEMDADNAERPETESAGKVPPGSSHWTPEENRRGAFDPVGPKTGPTVSEAASGSVRSSATKRKTTSSNLEVAPVSSNQHLDLQKTAAAVVIQQLWRKYRQKCGNISSLSAADKGGGRGGRGGDGGKPESGPSYVNGSVVGPDYAATVIQAFWRGFAVRRRLASALAGVSRPDAGEDDEDDDAFEFEEVDVDEFVFDEKRWTLSFSEDSSPRRCPASEPPLKPPEPSHYILPPPPVWRPKQAWLPAGQVDSAGPTGSPETSSRSKSPASSSVPSGLSQRSEKILEEWGFTDSHTALLMLKRAKKMKPTTQRQNKRRDPSFRPAFRNCSYPLAPVEARNRPARHNRSDMNGGEAEPGLRHAEREERVKRLRTRAAHPDSDSESVHFLPEISSDVLNGGRVQLVADPAYTSRPPHASGSGSSDRSAARPGREHDHPRRNSYGPSSGEVPSPRRVASAPSKKERISHRDNAVQLSGGWGGGKKRDKEYK